MKSLLSLIVFIFIFTPSFSQDRAFWTTIWSCNTADKIDKIIDNASSNGYNQIFIQARYRGDAMYYPNKIDSSYTNNESRSYILKGSAFDPLQYAIDKAKNKNIEIHAWVPIFAITPHDLTKIDSSHLYYTHNDWLTYDDKGEKMPYNVHEGAFLDPGVPQVQEYTLNILRDIAINYDIDGIQLDYIRYPDSIYGYNPIALEEFRKSGIDNFPKWKESQINSFVNRSFIMIKNINPNIKLSAAVFANQYKAVNILSQNWKQWLAKNYIDQVYVMAYNTSDNSYKKVIEGIDDVNREKTTIVLRAWIDNGHYSVHKINHKIIYSKKHNFKHFGFYSYSGLIKNKYIKTISY